MSKEKTVRKSVLSVIRYEAKSLKLTKKSAERVAQRPMERAIIRQDKEPKLKTMEHLTRMKWLWVGHIARTSYDRWTRRI